MESRFVSFMLLFLSCILLTGAVSHRLLVVLLLFVLLVLVLLVLVLLVLVLLLVQAEHRAIIEQV